MREVYPLKRSTWYFAVCPKGEEARRETLNSLDSFGWPALSGACEGTDILYIWRRNMEKNFSISRLHNAGWKFYKIPIPKGVR